MIIHQRYQDIINIMINNEFEHLGNIKDKAILSYVQGIQKTPAFVLRFKEEVDEVKEEIKEEKKVEKEKEARELELINQITGGKNSFKNKSACSAWLNIDMTKPLEIKPNTIVKTFCSLPKATMLQKKTIKQNKNMIYKHNSSQKAVLQHKKQIPQQENQLKQNIKQNKQQEISSQKQQEPIIIKKTVHSAWTNFTKSREDDQSHDYKKIMPPPQHNNQLQKIKKAQISNTSPKNISLPFVPEFKPKKTHASWKEFNNSQL